jgi:hypothetical protein
MIRDMLAAMLKVKSIIHGGAMVALLILEIIFDH